MMAFLFPQIFSNDTSTESDFFVCLANNRCISSLEMHPDNKTPMRKIIPNSESVTTSLNRNPVKSNKNLSEINLAESPAAIAAMRGFINQRLNSISNGMN